MKFFFCLLFLTVLFIVSPLPLHAQDPDGEAPGFSGRVQGSALYVRSDSQLSTEDDDSPNDDLEGPADARQAVLPLPTIFLRYQFESGTAIYFGNPLEGGEGLDVAAGVIQPLGDSTLDVALTWLPIKEVWENPYQTGTSRDESDVDNYGLRLKWQMIGGTPLEAEYNIRRIDVENDVIGNIDSDLKRDGWTHKLGVSYTLSLGKEDSLRPELSYAYGDIDGRSNSYRGFNIGVLFTRVQPPWVMIGHVGGSYKQYDKTHSIFDKTREEIGISTFGQLIRLNLFGVAPLFASVGAGYFWSDANIDFFDSHTIIGLASVGWEF